MLELMLLIGMCVLMAKIADADDRSGIIWGCLTFVLCLGSFSIAYPFLRVLGAGAAVFVLMIVSKGITER